jgi:guanylate kinase
MNQLKHLSEFRQLIADLKVSDDTESILINTKLVLLAAATSTGRNTIINHLLASNKYHYAVSDTTRKPRENDGVLEKNGVEYWFVSEDEFLDNLKKGNYIEAAIIHNQQVSGPRIDELKKASENNQIAISDFEVQGVSVIKKLKPDAIALFILPPSFEIWQDRLKSRGFMDEHEYLRRMQSAYNEFRDAKEKDYYSFVISRDINESIVHIEKIIRGDKSEQREQDKARILLDSLYKKTGELLEELKKQ